MQQQQSKREAVKEYVGCWERMRVCTFDNSKLHWWWYFRETVCSVCSYLKKNQEAVSKKRGGVGPWMSSFNFLSPRKSLFSGLHVVKLTTHEIQHCALCYSFHATYCSTTDWHVTTVVLSYFSGSWVFFGTKHGRGSSQLLLHNSVKT